MMSSINPGDRRGSYKRAPSNDSDSQMGPKPPQTAKLPGGYTLTLSPESMKSIFGNILRGSCRRTSQRKSPPKTPTEEEYSAIYLADKLREDAAKRLGLKPNNIRQITIYDNGQILVQQFPAPQKGEMDHGTLPPQNILNPTNKMEAIAKTLTKMSKESDTGYNGGDTYTLVFSYIFQSQEEEEKIKLKQLFKKARKEERKKCQERQETKTR